MGSGHSSGKNTSSRLAISATMQKNFDNANPTKRKEIMGAKWEKSKTSKKVSTFAVTGYGGARVEYAIDENGNGGWVASVWTPNSNLTPVKGGKLFASERDAKRYAKMVLVIRKD